MCVCASLCVDNSNFRCNAAGGGATLWTISDTVSLRCDRYTISSPRLSGSKKRHILVGHRALRWSVWGNSRISMSNTCTASIPDVDAVTVKRASHLCCRFLAHLFLSLLVSFLLSLNSHVALASCRFPPETGCEKLPDSHICAKNELSTLTLGFTCKECSFYWMNRLMYHAV